MDNRIEEIKQTLIEAKIENLQVYTEETHADHFEPRISLDGSVIRFPLCSLRGERGIELMGDCISVCELS